MVLPGNTKNSKTFGTANTPANQPGPRTISNAGGGFFGDIDFDNVEAGYASLPEGWYEGYVESIENGVSSAGNPQLVFTLQIVEDEDGNSASGRQKYWLTKTPKTLWKIKGDLQSLAVPDEEMATISNSDLINRFVMVRMGKNVGGNDPSRVVAMELGPSRSYFGQKFSPARRGVPGQ